MLSATNAFFVALFGDVLPNWFALDTVQYLVGVIVFTIIMSVIIKFIKRR